MPISRPPATSVPLSTAQIHAVLVGILRELIAICDTHEIQYCLIGGACLGIARHAGGFVPWDDDLDIAVGASDMPRLVAALAALPRHFTVRAKSDEVNAMYMVMDRRTRTIGGEDPDSATGVFVDIVPMMLWQSVAWKKADRTLERLRRLGWNAGSLRVMNAIKRALVLARVPDFAAWVGERHFHPLVRRHDIACRAAGRGIVTAAYRQGWVGLYEYGTVFPLQEATFCGVPVRVPRDLHGFLRKRYGPDYMREPPEEARWRHFSGALGVTEE